MDIWVVVQMVKDGYGGWEIGELSTFTSKDRAEDRKKELQNDYSTKDVQIYETYAH